MQPGRNSERRIMHIGDLVNAAALLIVGLFLGSVVNDLVRMATTDWLFALFIVLLFASLFLVVWIFDILFDRFFPIGIRTSRNSQGKERKPLPLLVSLPTGFVVGMVLARLGLDEAVLGVIF